MKLKVVTSILAVVLMVSLFPMNLHVSAQEPKMMDIPYIGDVSKCKMSVKQAQAYISVLKEAEKETTDYNGQKYDYNYAALIDVSGDGVPLLLVMHWIGNPDFDQNEQGNDANYQVWGYQNGNAINLSFDYGGIAIATWYGKNYFCVYNKQDLSVDDNICYTLYQVENGAVNYYHKIENLYQYASDQSVNLLKQGWVKSSADADLYELYKFDNARISKKEYAAYINGLSTNNLLYHIDISTDVGNSVGDPTYLALTKTSISDTANLLTALLPSLSTYDVVTTAQPSKASVSIDGTKASIPAYNIDGNNFIKLRDLAKLLSATQKQFDVSWDNTNKAINLVTNTAYTVVGGEMTSGDGNNKTATLNTSSVYKDKVAVKLTAYNIGGNNYFKLRDLGQAFNFGVAWDDATNTINIDTSKDYEPK